MTIEAYNQYSLILNAISSFVGLLMLGVAIWQLSKLTKSNEISQLSTLFDLERQIADRRLELSSAGIAVTELKDTTERPKLECATLRYNEAKEMYLNGLDRLCFCIRKESLLSEIDMRREYIFVINGAVNDFPADFNAINSPYKNIKSIYERWANNP